MKFRAACLFLLTVCFISGAVVRPVRAQQKSGSSTVQVHMVIGDESLRDDSELAVLRAENIQVKQGKNLLKVNSLIPARGDNAAMQLFILIDDTCDTGIGNNLNDLRDFINAQPPTTVIAVGYMSNATVQIAQNFTADHGLAAKAVRLPRGTLSSMDSPYLSLISLVKSWPEQKIRREVLMITDGIDRLRNRQQSTVRTATRPGVPPAATPTVTTLPSISVDADTASSISQRYGVIVHSIYAVGVGRVGRNAWEVQLGQSGIGKIADETGGEYYALGIQNLVSFKPYLDRLQRVFENQYYLVFEAQPKKNAGLQRVNISSDQPNTEIAAADNVWVPVGQ